MAFSVPVSKNYTSPLVAVPLDWVKPAKEGVKGIQCSITWSTAESGANKSVYLNMADNAPLEFSKIRAIVVDNSQNGSDVQVIFPDTETTFSIPAYLPYAVIPVFTNATAFYIQSPNALVTDKTAFMILNTLPPPIAVPTTQEQNFASVAGENVDNDGSVQMVTAGTNGTLENIFIAGYAHASAISVVVITVQLKDGEGNIIAQGSLRTDDATVVFGTLVSVDDVRVRFINGLVLSWTSTGASSGSSLNANLYYRTP